MDNAKTTGKRPVAEVGTSPRSSTSAKRHMTARPTIKKTAAASVNKESEGHPTSQGPPKGLATPPSEPEIIDLCIEVVAKPAGRPKGSFPRFNDGDVIIDLGLLGGDLSYQLHSTTLSRSSPWFDETSLHNIKEVDARFAADYTKRSGIRARYELSYNSDLKIFVLARTTLTEVKNPKESLPVKTTTVPSNADRPAQSKVSENVAGSFQQATCNTSANVLSNTQQTSSNSDLEQAAPTDSPATSEILDITSAKVLNDHIMPLSVPGQPPIKIEEPQIKQEDISSSAVIGNRNAILRQEVSIPAKENQVAPKEVPITDCAKENWVTNNRNQVTTQENYAVATDTPVETKDDGITQNRDSVPAEENPAINEDEQARPPSAELLAAYKCLFRAYYGQTPAIDTKNINVALRQMEAIIRVAELYGSIPVVRPHLGNCLLQFGRDVHEAILKDPPRWLQLSLYLENGPIFKEAAVHIIGNLGYWPWSTVQVKDLPDDLITLLQKKVDNLKRLIGDVERTLFMISINVEGEEALLAPTNKKTINTWYVEQLWKQWFTRSVGQDEAPKSTGRTDGAKYRAIAKGDDVYLPLETVVNYIEAFREPTRLTEVDKQGIEEDLKIIKAFAQKQVQLLCVNKSMLSIEETGIKHLTCASVDDFDISWVNQGGSRVED